MSMNLSKIARIFVYSFSVLCCGSNLLQAFPFIPFSLAALGLPLFGSVASSTKGDVKKTLANVDGMVGYVKLFLMAITIILFFILLIWCIKSVKRSFRRKKIHSIINLLHRIQTNIVMLKDKALLSTDQIKNIELSKKEAFSAFKYDSVESKKKFLRKNLGFSAYKSINQSCKLIEIGKIGLDGQMILVEQWLKKFDLLCR